ncbi:hypothetical protein FRB99_001712 [Tulasnella sp. 403]|nr:hypothetical protein FRB99_001712 [Tulasnella sp. 403]
MAARMDTPLLSPGVPDSPTLYNGRELKLTIYQDPSCPWCYIGEKEMHRALKTLQESEEDVRVVLEFKPFIIDPSLPRDKAIEMQERCAQRYGAQKWSIVQKLMASRGAAAGIDFKFNGPVRSPLLSHRLMMRAYQLGGGEAQKAIAFLTSHQLEEEVEREIMEARRRGITGVPFAVINDKWAICGALHKNTSKRGDSTMKLACMTVSTIIAVLRSAYSPPPL